jgi:hypothetical protein
VAVFHVVLPLMLPAEYYGTGGAGAVEELVFEEDEVVAADFDDALFDEVFASALE